MARLVDHDAIRFVDAIESGEFLFPRPGAVATIQPTRDHSGPPTRLVDLVDGPTAEALLALLGEDD
jgi:hypothetical protein